MRLSCWPSVSAAVLALVLTPLDLRAQAVSAPAESTKVQAVSAPAESTKVQTVSAPAESLTKAQMAHFLRTAKVVAHRSIPKGVTRPVRVTLSDGMLTHDAAFSFVEQRAPAMRLANGKMEFNFVDSYTYSIAAYRIAELIGMDDMIPVTVERQWDGREGALSWWIDAKWDEASRLKEQAEPPDSDGWNRQKHRMRVFTTLLADTDRNQGNVLITADWKLWIIDFTRAFRRTPELLEPQGLTRCERGLLASLRALKREDVEAATKRYLRKSDIDALMARRDAIVALFDRRIAELGEPSVLY